MDAAYDDAVYDDDVADESVAFDAADERVDEYPDVESALKIARREAPRPAPTHAAPPRSAAVAGADASARSAQPSPMDWGNEEEEAVADEHDATFAEHFAPYFRKPEEMFSPMEFMLTSAECISSKLRGDLDDALADHSPLQEPEDKAWMARYRKRAAEPMILVPVIKLYGVTRAGSSVCLDVYGFYPCFRLRVVRGEIRYNTLERMRTFIETNVLHTEPSKPRQVVSAEMVRGYPAFPYTPEPGTFMEFRLAHSRHINALSKHFAGDLEMDDSAGGTMVLSPYSADDTLTQFMVTKKITGCGWIRAADLMEPNNEHKREMEKCPCSFILDCNSRSVQPVPLVAFDEVAPLRVMGLDIECRKQAGMPDPKKHAIIIIGVEVSTAVQGMMGEGPSTKRILFMWHPSAQIDKVERSDLQFNYADEKSMLVAFGSFVRAYDPDIYLGHNIVGFDIPYIVVRANHLGVKLLAHLGRRCKFSWTAPREIKSQRKNGSQRKTLRTDTPGVVQLDTLPLMQGASKESSYKLGNLAAKWLGDTKADVGYQMIDPLWLRSPETRGRLADYCLKDVLLAMQLAKHPKLEFVLTVVNLARETRVIPERLLRSGNQEKVRTLVLHQSLEANFDKANTPVFFPYEVPKQRAKDDKFEGATVINPKRGNSELPVAVGDFKSLYPSIMVSNNLCYTTELLMPGDRTPDGALVPHHLAPDTGAKFVHSEVREGLLPKILKHLLNSRDQAKAMMKRCGSDPARKKYYDSKQLQLKIIANSVYGVLTASGGWFVRMEIGESVTSWGRSMIHQAKLLAEAEPFNAEVIYGDTDSIMMVFKDCKTVQEAAEKNKLVCKTVSGIFPPPVELQPEKVYFPHCQFGKKKYVGLCHIPPDPPKVDSKGVEKNRLDNCPLIRRIMTKVFDLLMTENNNVAGAMRYIHESVKDLIQGRVDYADLVVTRSISKSEEEYAGKQIHIEVANRMKARDPSYMIAPGERIPYVIVLNGASKKGPLCDRAEDPLWAIQHNLDIDVQYYIEKQLTNPLARVMMWYILPKDMLREIRSIEQTIDKIPEKDTVRIEAAEKRLKKLMDKGMEHAGKMMFGPAALADIKRPKQRHNGPLAAFFKRQPMEKAELEKAMVPLRARLAEYKAKCTKCRGYEDDKIACVQRDCPTLFCMATVNRDMEDLMNR